MKGVVLYICVSGMYIFQLSPVVARIELYSVGMNDYLLYIARMYDRGVRQ